MNIKDEILKGLKNLLGSFEKTYTASELKVSDMAVGGKVELINADGTLSDAPDGDYAMEDGFAFTVKDSVIVSIVGEDAAPADVPAVEDVKAADVPVDVPVVETPADEVKEDTAFADLSAKVDELSKKVDDCVKLCNDCMGQISTDKAAEASMKKNDLEAFTKQLSDLNLTIATLAKIPVEFSKTSKNNDVNDERNAQLIELGKMLKGK